MKDWIQVLAHSTQELWAIISDLVCWGRAYYVGQNSPYNTYYQQKFSIFVANKNILLKNLSTHDHLLDDLTCIVNLD